MKRFSNPWPHDEHGVADILKWKLGLLPREEISHQDDSPAPVQAITREALHATPEHGWQVVWLGHASFLLRSREFTLWIDPIFSAHCAPLPFPSLKRHAPAPCALDDLPLPDAVLITHSHYDHLDLPTLRKLSANTLILHPEGHAEFFARHGFTRTRDVAWWQEVEPLPGLKITATPAQHFTARTPFDRNLAHWCGWHIAAGGHCLWHAGDSAYCPAFREICERLPRIDLAMLPIGAYLPRSIMKAMHMNPQEAVQAWCDSGAKRAVAMHWGTFRLTDEPLSEPPYLLREELRKRGLPSCDFTVPAIGEVLRVGGP